MRTSKMCDKCYKRLPQPVRVQLVALCSSCMDDRIRLIAEQVQHNQLVIAKQELKSKRKALEQHFDNVYGEDRLA